MTNANPLMPKATAVWLVENTSLSFEQIADFCKLHPLEVKAIADGESALTIKGLDPILSGQLTREEIAAGEADPNHHLVMADRKVRVPLPAKRKGPRYTPVSRRQDRPNAVLWLLRNHPELKDAQIMRLVGTTKPTIDSIRNRTHWNANNLQPLDPVTLGLCSQIDLDFEVERAAKNAPATGAAVEPQGATLLPAAQTTTAAALAAAAIRPAANAERAADREADAVFAKLKSMRGSDESKDD
ncbi:MAG TPA: cell cycle transcriptional regulator TrcR [Bauldia sp.]|nr:cell cycle transcriptional regulator TrcR [Bauldia sp.]